MKVLPLLLALTLLASTYAAEPVKRQAFGPIQFGEPQADAEAHLRIVLDDLNKRRAESLTAADVARNFITSETRQPPTLAAQYDKTAIALNMAAGYPLTTIAIQTQFTGETAKLKADWEVLRDVAVSKFGPPTTSTPLPELQGLKRGIVTTDEWTTANGIKIVLALHVFTADRLSVNLNATVIPATAPSPETAAPK